MHCIFACVLTLGIGEVQPIEYEVKAIEYRKQIKSAHVVAVITSDASDPESAAASCFGVRLEVWSDAQNNRTDETAIPGWPPLTRGKDRTIHCRGCCPDGKVVRYASQTAVVLEPASVDTTFIDRQLFDPRRLGHSMYGVFASRTISGDLTSPEIIYKSAEWVRYKGEEAVLIRGTFAKHERVHRRCWVCPSKGYSLLRLETSDADEPNGDRPIGQFLETELAQDVNSGVWFPKQIRRVTYVQGKLNSEQTVDVQVAEFNRPLDPKAMSLAGMNLTPGTPVSDRATGTIIFWSGSELTKSYSGPPPPELMAQAIPLADMKPETPTVIPSRTPGWVYGLAATLAVVGCGLFVLARRFRR